MALKTAERVSQDVTDNFVYRRSRLAYMAAAELVGGEVLEIGTGTGYGIEIIAPHTTRFTTLDKHRSPKVNKLPRGVEFREAKVPPLPFDDQTFDYVVSFQVIEHIKRDKEFVREVYRVLKRGGRFIVTTPNRPMSLTRNPWHVREYTSDELKALLSDFASVEARGVHGNDKVMAYYERNRESVRRIMRFDILKMQWWLPRWLLQLPYDILNRINRRGLHSRNRELTEGIREDDYDIREVGDSCFDLFYIAQK
ncbi:MAG: class I SAM-dependent methyltransferase [Alistipes sp.]|nr:class I SAM-dependent methyltransferase [Alistipes sp.]